MMTPEERENRLKSYIDAEVRRVVAGLPIPREGPPGRDGRDGMAGTPGERGAPGEQGERGADGLQGRDGFPGAPGPQGERGTNGIATREELEELIEARFTDLQVRSFADTYREVFKPSEQYRRGEFVTWDGSMWLAMADSTERPGTNSDWALVVKHGREASRR